MAELMEVDGGPERHLLSVESIKAMAESVGISGLGDEACKRLSEDLEYRLKEVVQNAIKFSRHSKRRKVTCTDIDHALKLKNIEPLYGFECAEYIPLRHTSGGGKDLYYCDDQEIDLVDVISSPLPKLPCDVTLRAHWLAVEGVQPSIPENVPPASLEEQRKQATAATLTSNQDGTVQSRDIKFDRRKKKEKEEIPSNGEWSKLKPLQTHGLSLEQQLYYKEITDACIGLSDSKRQEALTSLSVDPGLYQLLPQLISFIVEGVKVNIAHHKLVMLRHLMRMVKALLDNTAISLEKFLHDLLPSVTSCLLNRQICLRPESEDHWSVRDQAAKILAAICRKYSNTVNSVQGRLTRILSQALNNNTQGLAVHYAAVMAFVEMGQETVTALVVPRLKQEGELIKSVQLATSQVKVAEQIAANKLQNLLQKHCAPSLVQLRSVTDTTQVFQNEYGYLGPALYNQVKALRQGRPTVSALALHMGQKTPSPTLRSPTSPLPISKTRPPPLTIPVTATKITVSPRVPNLASPTQLAAALRVVTQSASTSQSSSSPVVSIPASILSAVVNNPSVAQAVLASQKLIMSSETSPTHSASSSQDSTPSTVPTSRRSSTGSN